MVAVTTQAIMMVMMHYCALTITIHVCDYAHAHSGTNSTCKMFVVMDNVYAALSAHVHWLSVGFQLDFRKSYTCPRTLPLQNCSCRNSCKHSSTRLPVKDVHKMPAGVLYIVYMSSVAVIQEVVRIIAFVRRGCVLVI